MHVLTNTTKPEDHPHRVEGKHWVSGDWVVSSERATQLIGQMFCVHEKQKVESHHGGIIFLMELLENGRYAVHYTFDENARGVRCTTWGSAAAVAYS